MISCQSRGLLSIANIWMEMERVCQMLVEAAELLMQCRGSWIQTPQVLRCTRIAAS